MISNDNFDTEAQIMPGKRDKFHKNKVNDFADDTRSMISM